MNVLLATVALDSVWCTGCGKASPESEWIRTYDVATANGLPFSTLMFSSPVFFTNPPAMFTATITPDTQNRILAYGIPALSTAIGHEKVGPEGYPVFRAEINMNDDNAIPRPNGWWRPGSGDLDGRWLHSDMVEVAYFYVYKLFNDFGKSIGVVIRLRQAKSIERE
jgi:hypothetical protein